jgi:hypothetical protein
MNLIPPLRLLDRFDLWAADDGVFWTHRVEQAFLLREYCRSTKDFIVWLEMHGREAARLDRTVSDLKERWSEFSCLCEGLRPYAAENPDCREALAQVVNAVHHLCGALEDLAAEVPDSCWEGFDDV